MESALENGDKGVTDIYDLAGEPRPKFCINCKHIGRNGSGDAQRYRCFAEQNVVKRFTDLVTGNSATKFIYESCYAAREQSFTVGIDSCGPEGRWFEPVSPVMRIGATDLRPGGVKHVAADLLSQLDKMP